MRSESHSCGPQVDLLVSRLYERMWGFCAGWNRVPFKYPQLSYILRKFDVELSVAALGSTEGLAFRTDGIRCVVLSRRLCPQVGRRTTQADLWSAIGERLTLRARFVLLHELTHALIHDEDPTLWVRFANCKMPSRMLSAFHLETLAPHTIREAEADLVALVALVPDSVLLPWAEDGSLSADRVVSFLSAEGSFGTGDDAIALAEYRIDVFKKFAHLFMKASQALNDPPGEHFRSPHTIDGKSAQEIASIADAPSSARPGDLVRLHPRIRCDSELCDALDSGEVCPFSDLLADVTRGERASP